VEISYGAKYVSVVFFRVRDLNCRRRASLNRIHFERVHAHCVIDSNSRNEETTSERTRYNRKGRKASRRKTQNFPVPHHTTQVERDEDLILHSRLSARKQGRSSYHSKVPLDMTAEGFMNPENFKITNSNPSYWTLLNTGGSNDLARVLDILSPQAMENYLPFKSKKATGFTNGLYNRFYSNCSIQDATKHRERLLLQQSLAEKKMRTLKASFDSQTIKIAKIQRQLAMKQKQR